MQLYPLQQHNVMRGETGFQIDLDTARRQFKVYFERL